MVQNAVKEAKSAACAIAAAEWAHCARDNQRYQRNDAQFSINATVPRPPTAQMLAIARLPFGNMASSLKNGGRPRRGETGSAAAYPGSGEETPGIRNVGVNPEIEFANIVAIVPILRRFSDCLPTR
jgi:hypothetical protein